MMREWREEVRLGIIREWSPWSRVTGRSRSRSRVDGLKDAYSLSEGAIYGVVNAQWLVNSARRPGVGNMSNASSE